MHASLRDQWALKALCLNVCLLVASSFLCAFVFADLSVFGVTPDASRIALGLLSIATFSLSLVELRVDWKGKATLHNDAVKKLSALKNEYRQSYSRFKGCDREENDRLSEEYSKVLTDIISVPEAQFLSLKAEYLSKVELSRLISRYPGVPLGLLRLKLMFHSMRKPK
jgi:hypothetical protein